ncbi:MAG: site-specific integrase [Spirochaetales bacterium]|nr:site-specific integrase [Spirochaetales bacterium]MBQ7645213.1 site-specific integrase [Spirochaetales bacterium]
MGRMRAPEGTFTLYRRKNGYWYYWTYDRYSKRHHRSTGVKNKQLAMKVCIQRTQDGTLLSDLGVKKYITLGEFSKDFFLYDSCPYIQSRLARGFLYSRKTAANNRYYLETYIWKTFGNRILESITSEEVNRWILALPRKTKMSNKTANGILILLKQIFGMAMERGVVPANPASTVRPLAKGANAKRRIAFTSEQINLLFGSPWPNMLAYNACKLSAFTGMRAGEIRALLPKQIFKDHILVDASYNNGEDGRKCTKAGYARIIPINDEIYRLLRSLTSGRGYIFSLDGKTPVGSHYFERPLKKRMEELGITAPKGTELTFHSFRHFMNSRLIAAGLSGEKIRAVIGHESEDMTEHYAHLEAEDLRQVLDVQKNILTNKEGQQSGTLLS